MTINIGSGMSNGCMSLVLLWNTTFDLNAVFNLYNDKNSTRTSFQSNVIWDWNWGVYTYLNTKSVTRSYSSQRGLAGVTKCDR